MFKGCMWENSEHLASCKTKSNIYDVTYCMCFRRTSFL